MKEELLKTISDAITGKETWSDFGINFSRIYFDKKRNSEFETLDDRTVDFFGFVNDLIEYTDDSMSIDERRDLGFQSSEDAIRCLQKEYAKTMLGIVR